MGISSIRRGAVGAAAVLCVSIALALSASAVGAHSGGTDEFGCHGGSVPRHCHNGDDDGGSGVPATTAVPVTPQPVPAPPSTAASTTTSVPAPAPEVAGITTGQQPSAAPQATAELARTGTSEWVMAGVAAALISLGLGLIGTGEYATRMVTARPGGGFTLTLTNPFGEHVVFRVTSRSRFGRVATWLARRRRR